MIAGSSSKIPDMILTKFHAAIAGVQRTASTALKANRLPLDTFHTTYGEMALTAISSPN